MNLTITSVIHEPLLFAGMGKHTGSCTTPQTRASAWLNAWHASQPMLHLRCQPCALSFCSTAPSAWQGEATTCISSLIVAYADVQGSSMHHLHWKPLRGLCLLHQEIPCIWLL